MKKMRAAMFCVCTAVILTTAMSGYAQTCPGSPGCLDPNFGIGGTTITYIPATKPLTPGKSAIQSDGKILALVLVLPGDSFTNAIIRYNPDGTLDPSFGSGGIVI